MKKTVLVLISGIILLGVFGMEAKAQVPKEGSGSQAWAWSGTFKALPMGQERVEMTWEIMGVVIADTSEDLFHNSSFRCLGALHAVKGEYNESGFCVATRPDGDQVFFTIKGPGKLGVGAKGTSTIVGGTGKLTGVQGSPEYTVFDVRPAAEGTIQGYNRGKGHYKLP